jgi:hypothetical protein
MLSKGISEREGTGMSFFIDKNKKIFPPGWSKTLNHKNGLKNGING